MAEVKQGANPPEPISSPSLDRLSGARSDDRARILFRLASSLATRRRSAGSWFRHFLLGPFQEVRNCCFRIRVEQRNILDRAAGHQSFCALDCDEYSEMLSYTLGTTAIMNQRLWSTLSDFELLSPRRFQAERSPLGTQDNESLLLRTRLCATCLSSAGSGLYPVPMVQQGAKSLPLFAGAAPTGSLLGR